MSANVYYKPVRLIIAVIVAVIVAFFVASEFGVAGAKSVSIAMIVVALFLMLAVPRASPHHMSFDLKTPTTSAIMGNMVTRMSTTYFSLELLVGAFFIYYGSDRVFLCFFLQLALLIIFASSISYVMARDSQKAGMSDPLSAHLGVALGTDRMDHLVKQVYDAQLYLGNVNDDARNLITQLPAAAESAHQQSYEGTLKLESQIGSLLDRLAAAAQKGDSKEAFACARLATLLFEEREEYFSSAQQSLKAQQQEERKQEFNRRRGAAFIKATREARSQAKANKRGNKASTKDETGARRDTSTTYKA